MIKSMSVRMRRNSVQCVYSSILSDVVELMISALGFVDVGLVGLGVGAILGDSMSGLEKSRVLVCRRDFCRG